MSRAGKIVIGAGSTLAALTLFVLLSLFWPWPFVRLLASTCDEVLFFTETDLPLVALTLDDGPDSTTTSALLDVLDAHEAKATFFVIGNRVRGNESVVRRIVNEGHEIANHGFRDEPAILLSGAELRRSIDSTRKLLAAFQKPRWFRPGSGLVDDRMIEIAQGQGYQVVLGSVYPFDSTIEQSDFSSWFILRNVQPGSIIILHDHGENGRRSARTLRRILPELARRGYRLVTLSNLASASLQTRP